MLEVLLAVAGGAAGAVLVVSGVLKLGRTERFRASLAALGLPAPLSANPLFARVFPLVEIALGIAILLAPAPLHRGALLGAVAVDVVFLVVAIRAVRAPEPVECECFGGLGDARMTGRTVARNGVLLALALAGLLGPIAPAGLLVRGVPALVAVLLALALVPVRDRLAARTPTAAVPAAADPAPAPVDLVLRTAAGDPIALAEWADPPTHLVFFSPNCGSCHDLVERFRWWPNGLRPGEELQPVFLGEPADFAPHAVFAPLIEHALYDPERSVAAALGRGSTPGHVLLDPAHPLGDGWTSGEAEIEKRVLRPGFFEELR
ncbi:MauE/DoxX family redox-associated membrane protein [Rathayibacter sp. VKM Ac-2760]|uniref:MauE/DoxX family redox-associated membrane protein n=1 Tax=Rathayibacter sp. VKM Ac-2760 TaxID=2609253 RepID=UPI001318984B|nr:MauE/DoxX family redox-associated membrane protein [Rathayibacter sp. VKM Ac-2760]QHC59964.1 hypothetical protein GSU72_16470 [Rathayibacter sp. VKM Ac-2760]